MRTILWGVLPSYFIQSVCSACLHRPRSWFKGADTTSVCKYLQNLFEETLRNYEGRHGLYLRAIHGALVGGNGFLSTMYRGHLFLSPAEALECSQYGARLLQCYLEAASYAHACDLTRFKVTPKLHIAFHLVDRLHKEGLRGRETLNPVSWSCQMDEDLVGRVCTWSRAQSIRAVHTRTIRAYLVNLRPHLQDI